MAGILNLLGEPIPSIEHKVNVLGELIKHRGPDGEGRWANASNEVGLAHQRLTIIDLSDMGAQPMHAQNGTSLTFNGEIYNYIELREQLSNKWGFQTNSDTECIFAAYEQWGDQCVDHLRGMFAFALWDEKKKKLLLARDRFGIKPLYYALLGEQLVFASEIKALLPFLPAITTNPLALTEYITFQQPMTDLTMFDGVRQLMPGHIMSVQNGNSKIHKYWDVVFDHDDSMTLDSCQQRIRELMSDSINVHLRADVPIGSYLSGGIDSSLVAMMAKQQDSQNTQTFHGKFTCHPGYDESHFAQMVADQSDLQMHSIDISSADFIQNIDKIIYHLDHPIAGPGSFPQYMVSQLASKHVKVVLGGQGGDEIFGGYARYMVGYLERLLLGALDGELNTGKFPISFGDIVPNLTVLKEYKPLMGQFFAKGLFEDLPSRYFRLVDRSTDMQDEVDWGVLDKGHARNAFDEAFHSQTAFPDGQGQDFDRMTHFDFKRLLPALLQIEDRMSMAHGIESRVPFLDHNLVEFMATVPNKIKFEGGKLKQLLKSTYKDILPKPIVERRDKMGFPVPLKEWYQSDLSDFVQDTFRTEAARSRPFMRSDHILANFDQGGQFSRKTWGLLSLELWFQKFHDQQSKYKNLVKD
ncbi:MAG: asparagine synthase (glutamine-hydrolyzing) [Robiginitomaculum sp.]|nr:asparagine synthase (glutamine-hydrolyzing) [Robiginitomaculum sp.]